jgi:ADP-ribosylglycohydrolase
MRIAPLAVWASFESDDEIARLASEDAKLSHSSGAVIASTAAYSVALAALVRGETPRSAIERAARWLRTKAGDDGADEVALWLADSDIIHSSMTSARFSHVGWARHAFVLSFWHLSSNSTFEEAMREILTLGGDSDTNAAIVGAMLGARDGYPKIPKLWKQRVLDFDSTTGRHPRPPKYHPHNFFYFVDGIFRT